jgi:hypothetical protein
VREEPPIDLQAFEARIYSESGEDGILAKLFALLGVERGFFVEFGAWDGRRLSNTRLLRERGWRGILIEADADKFAELERNVAGEPVTPVHARVGLEGEDRLDAILARAECPDAFELLSIDVDSDDLAIWMAVEQYRPACVVIEFNVTIPFDIDFINPPGKAWGNSAKSILGVAEAKGYVLAAVTYMNLVLVERGAFERAGLKPAVLDARRLAIGQRLFWGYDGTLIHWNAEEGAIAPELLQVPWHNYRFPQPMPRPLRRWELGNKRPRLEWGVATLSTLLSRPIALLSRKRRG